MAQSVELSGSQVNVTPKTINSVSTLNLIANLNTEVPASGKIVITLPATMSVNSITSCSFAEPTTIVVASCAQTSSNVVTATLGTTPLPGSFFQLDITSVVNPPSTTTTSSFQFRTENAAGATLDFQNSNIFLVATAGTLTASTLTPTSQVVGATTTLAVTFIPANKVLSGGKIKMTFPKWNANALISSEILSMITSSTPTVTSTSAFLDTSGMTSAFASDVLTISGAITSDIAVGSAVTFSVSGFRNPITTQTFSGFTIQTTDSSDGVIDSGSATIRITTPTALTSTSATTRGSNIVQEPAEFRVQFTVPVPLNTGCIMDVKFPSDFSPTESDLTSVIGLSLFGGKRTLTGSLNVGNNTYTITDGCQNYITSNSIGIIDFNSLDNPFSIKTTESFEIYIKDSSQFLIAQITTGITYTASVGTLTGISIVPEGTTVSSVTAATFKFLPAHSLLADDTNIVITLPSDVSLADQTDSASCSVTDLVFISPTVKCTVISNVITLIDVFSVNYTPSSSEVLSFKIEGMTMPPSVKPIGATTFVTQVGTTTFYSVDSASQSTLFVATVGSMSEYSTTPTSLTAYTSTTYTFAFKPQNVILQNGFVTVDIPSQVTIPTPATSASSCTAVTGFPSAISCTISGSKITVNNGFTSAAVAAGTQVSFSIGSIRNPVSTSTTDSFTFTTFDSSNYQINTRSSGITVTMTSVPDLQRAQVSLGSSKNGDTTTYTFTIIASSPLTNTDRIYIKVPDSITPPTTPT